jgi:hypothetical protein
MMEISGSRSIIHAADITKSLGVKKDVVKRLKRYVDKVESVDNLGKDEWTPARFNTLGWKYQKPGHTDKYLNHFNKINDSGGYGPM